LSGWFDITGWMVFSPMFASNESGFMGWRLFWPV